jgi:hypothetical protein
VQPSLGAVAPLSDLLGNTCERFCHGTAEKGGDPELVRESQRRRYADVSLVDKVVELDAEWRAGELTGGFRAV